MEDEWEYWIEPINGWKYGFPKRIPSHITLDKVYEWLPDNGLALGEITGNKLFDYKIWRKKVEGRNE